MSTPQARWIVLTCAALLAAFAVACVGGGGGGGSGGLPVNGTMIGPPPPPVDAPTITGVNPSSISAGIANQQVQVLGTNFSPGNMTVTINGANAAVVAATTTTITVNVPNNVSAGPASIVVTNSLNGKSGTSTTALAVYSPPTVTSVSPNIGPTSGGTQVDVVGTNFKTGATVKFSTVLATIVTVTATKITVTVPSSSAGAVAVTVTNPDGTSATLASGYRYLLPPQISAISPAFGSASGGDSITISGFNFEAGATVKIGGQTATGVTVQSAARIACFTPVVPPGLADVMVTNPDGQTNTKTGAFEYRDDAVLDGLVFGGPVSAGTVEVYAVAEGGTLTPVFKGGSAATALTDAAGVFSGLNIGTARGTLLLQVASGSYYEENNPKIAANPGAAAIVLSSSQAIRAILPDVTNSTTTQRGLVITPLSTLAAKMALARASRGGIASVAATANAQVKVAFHLTGDLLTTKAKHLSAEPGITNLNVQTDPEAVAGAVLAGLSATALALKDATTTPNSVTLALALGTDAAIDSKFDGQDQSPASPVKIGTVTVPATVLTTELPTALKGFIQNTLAPYNTSNLVSNGTASTTDTRPLENLFATSGTTLPDPPVITKVTPSTGTTTGGGTVTVEGSNFPATQAEAKVEFGAGNQATITAYNVTGSPHTATVTAPALPVGKAAGPVDVILTNSTTALSGSLAAGYTYGQNNAPTVSVQTPAAGAGDITVKFDLTDVESDPCTLTVQFKGGTVGVYTAANIVGFPSGVATGISPGTGLNFVWKSGANLVGVKATDVRIKLTADDGKGGTPATSETGAFTVDNSAAATNQAPVVTLGAITGTKSGNQVQIPFQVSDTEGDTVNLTTEYSTDGGTTFQTCADGLGGSGRANLTAGTTAPGTSYTYHWDSVVNVPASAGVKNMVKVRLTAADNQGGTPQPAVSAAFTVDNTAAPTNTPPSVAVTTPASTVGGNAVLIDYTITDPDVGNQISITVEYTIDSGVTWK
ncbi:MAG: IPT/TIG domain-containing protein, partial [Planctomycetes bacterium]|nr:IPT/TIG domain-containing protein [Planctomycetota bacterium]